eukprot:2863640-Alexandrium_andersonii.AAC.1
MACRPPVTATASPARGHAAAEAAPHHWEAARAAASSDGAPLRAAWPLAGRERGHLPLDDALEPAQ